MVQTKSEVELFRAGDTVAYSGEYCIVDQQGNQQNYDLVTLDEGEQFPQLPGQNLYYKLHDTCLEEACEVVGGPTPEIE